MQITGGYPAADAYEPESRGAVAERKARRTADWIAVKAAAAEYRKTLAQEKAIAAARLVEDVIRQPENAEEFIDRPLELLKIAAVAESGLDVRGVANLAEYCARRAAQIEPAKYGKAADLTIGLSSSLEAMLDRLADARVVAVQNPALDAGKKG